jgi:phage gp16-like protein
MDHRRLGLVHLAAKALGLDDDAYRAFLKSRVGVTSARDLNAAQFRTIMEEFERLGFKSRRRPRSFYHERLAYWDSQGLRAGMATPEQSARIEDLWERVSRAADKPKALRTFLQKRFGVSDMRFLETGKASNALNALRAMERRGR